MKSLKILVLSSLLFVSKILPIQAGILDQAIGARSAGLGFTSVTMIDFWSAIQNQAGLASISSTSIGTYVENKFLLKSLNTQAFAIAQPVPNGTIGLSIIRFGETAYNETMTGLSYGIKLSKNFAAGIQLFHYAINQSGYSESSEIFSFRGGFIYAHENRMLIAFHFSNPKFTSHSNAKIDLAEIVRFGISYHLSEALQGFLEFQSHSKLGQGLNSGIEFKRPGKIAFRIGYSTVNESLTFGIGLKIKKLSLDLSSSMHHQLGYSPQVSISYAF